MNNPRREAEQQIPINPYWVGGSFLEYCVRQGWMSKQREGRSTRYFCTPAGVEGLKQFGIEVFRRQVAHPKGRAKRSEG